MTEPTVNAIGLKLDTTSPLDYPPAVCLYGPAGAGKSTEMCAAFPHALYIQTSPTVLQPVDSLVRWMAKPETTDKMIEEKGYDPALRDVLRVPDKITIPKYVPGTNQPLDPRPVLNKIFQNYLDASMKGTNPYSGIIIDEWTEMSHRIQAGIEQDLSFGKNAFKKIIHLKELHYQLAELPRATNTVLGLVCHEKEPVLDMDENSPTYGALKHRGGPKMPIATLTHDVAAAMDVVLRIVIDKPTMPGKPSRRSYVTEIQPDWISKIRSCEASHKEPLGLRGLLTRSGYKLS